MLAATRLRLNQQRQAYERRATGRAATGPPFTVNVNFAEKGLWISPISKRWPAQSKIIGRKVFACNARSVPIPQQRRALYPVPNGGIRVEFSALLFERGIVARLFIAVTTVLSFSINLN